MKLKNKKTGETKYFTRRDEFIIFLLNEAKKVVVVDLRILTMEQLVDKYLKDWYVVKE